MASLPFFDVVDLDTVDVMLVTHFHLDHCAAVPYVCAHTSFKVRARALGAQIGPLTHSLAAACCRSAAAHNSPPGSPRPAKQN